MKIPDENKSIYWLWAYIKISSCGKELMQDSNMLITEDLEQIKKCGVSWRQTKPNTQYSKITN